MARDIGEWLEQLGLGEYAEAFAKNRIKFDHLADLSEDDLRELGVAAMGDRKTLSRAIAALADDSVEPAEMTNGGPEGVVSDSWWKLVLVVAPDHDGCSIRRRGQSAA